MTRSWESQLARSQGASFVYPVCLQWINIIQTVTLVLLQEGYLELDCNTRGNQIRGSSRQFDGKIQIPLGQLILLGWELILAQSHRRRPDQ
jgi:hypothetical protein